MKNINPKLKDILIVVLLDALLMIMSLSVFDMYGGNNVKSGKKTHSMSEQKKMLQLEDIDKVLDFLE